MAALSVATTTTTPADLLQAYREDEEEFYGSPDDVEISEQLSPANSDEDELNSSDSESDTVARSFIGQSDNDEVMIANQDVERREVRDRMQRGCGCNFDCYSQFTENEVFLTRLQMQELEKTQKDFYLLGKLQVLGKGSDASISHARSTTSGKRQRITYQYAYDHRVVCKEGFLYLHCIGERVLKNLQKHLKENGITQREHGNKGRLPPNAFSFESVQNIVDFIVNYATTFGLPQPAARRGRAGEAPVYLPASEGYNTVHQKYVEACLTSGKHAAKYHSFRHIWLQCLPHVQFMTPRTDVCHYCEEYRVLIVKAISENDKVRLAQEFKEHVAEAQKER